MILGTVAALDRVVALRSMVSILLAVVALLDGAVADATSDLSRGELPEDLSAVYDCVRFPW